MKLHKLATLIFSVAAGAAHAQNPTGAASIPFNFEVHGHTLSAGNYRINEILGGTLMVRRVDGKAGAMALATNIVPADLRESPRLVFRRYDNRYFLSEVWIPGKYHCTLTWTPMEREFAAGKNDPGEFVRVALH